MAADDLYATLPVPAMSGADLGVPDLPPAPIVKPPTGPNPKVGLAQALIALVAGMNGGNAGRGIALGLGQNLQQQHTDTLIAQQKAQAEQDRQNVLYEQQRRQNQADTLKRQEDLARYIGDMRKQVGSSSNAYSQEQYDQLVPLFANSLRMQGYRTMTPDLIRQSVPFIKHEDKDISGQLFDKIINADTSKEILKQNPSLLMNGKIDQFANVPTALKGLTVAQLGLHAGRLVQDAQGNPVLPTASQVNVKPGTSFQEALTAERSDFAKKNPDRTPTLAEENQMIANANRTAEMGKEKAAAAATAQTAPKVGSREYTIANDLAFGRLTFGQFRSLYSYSRDVNAKTGIYALAEDLNPNFNPAQFEMGLKFAENPKVQQQVASIRNVETGVPDLLKFSDQAKRMGASILNNAIIRGGVALGGKRYSNFAAARTAFADELSGALGYGSATDMARQMGFDMTDPSLSPENFRSAIETVVVPFVARKKASLLGPMGIYGAMSPGEQPAAAAPAAPAAGGNIGRFQVIEVK